MLALPGRVTPQTLCEKEIVAAGWLGRLYGVTFFFCEGSGSADSSELSKVVVRVSGTGWWRPFDLAGYSRSGPGLLYHE